MARLRVAGPEGEVVYSLSGRFTIGLLATNSLALPNDRAVSREHASIEPLASSCVLHDLMSANGTFIERGDEKVRVAGPTPLRSGDIIHIGRTRLLFDASDEVGGFDGGPAGDATLVPGSTIVGRVLPRLRDSVT